MVREFFQVYFKRFAWPLAIAAVIVFVGTQFNFTATAIGVAAAAIFAAIALVVEGFVRARRSRAEHDPGSIATSMDLWSGKAVGGRARAGKLAGRAILFVPLDGIWELHDLPWHRPGGECDDSYWDDDPRTTAEVESWEVDWVESSQLRGFIAEHFHGLDADAITRSSA